MAYERSLKTVHENSCIYFLQLSEMVVTDHI